jgi:lipopolysaccharide/colanic/teichoic acid biosynthesis glycosyltransferase
MKALFHIQQSDTPELKNFFAGTHPWMVKIANKPSLEYLLDFAILSGCTEIRLVMDEPDLALRNYFGEGERWGINISYASCSENDSLDKLLAKNSRFCDPGPLLILTGLFFIHYHKDHSYQDWQRLSASGMMLHCPTGTLLYGKTGNDLRYLSDMRKEVDFTLSPIRSLRDVYDLTMQVLKFEQEHYVLPGYGPEKNILIGRNVEIGRQVELHPPLTIADDTILLGKTVIGPNAAIGKGAIIDRGTTISNAVVTDHTYLGKGLTLSKKMVNGGRLFSAPDNDWLNLSDDLFFRIIEPQGVSNFLRSAIDRLAALLLLIILLPAWILFKIATCFTEKKSRTITCFKNKEGNLFSYTSDLPVSKSTADGFFRALSLNKVQLLVKVLSGTISLVGNRPVPSTPKNLQFIQNFDHYHPGAFGYSEAQQLTPGSLEEETLERFFAANTKITHDIRTLFNILLKNLRTFI